MLPCPSEVHLARRFAVRWAFERAAAAEELESPRLGKFSLGAVVFCANLSCGPSLRNVPLIEVMIRTASSGVARNVPIPVHVERTRTLARNLLTGGTVLGQRHWSWSAKNEDRSGSAGLRARIFFSRALFIRVRARRGRPPCGLRKRGSGRPIPQPACGRAARLRRCRCWRGFR